MARTSLRGLFGLAWLLLPIFARAMSAPVSPSPAADHDLICNPEDITDCYPRVFNPTKDFQPIREGQDLPPGLHVRMDIYSGTKEARLNITMEGEEGAALEAALEGLPVEQSVIVVDQPEPEPEPNTKPAMRDQVPIKAPSYKNAGKILPPPPSDDTTEMGSFQTALLSIKMESRAFDNALDTLMDLSHDIYYGLEIAKDGPVLEKLICLLLSSGSSKSPSETAERAHKAASIIASSLQNNPTALHEVSKWGNMVFYPICPASTQPGKVDLVDSLHSRLSSTTSAPTLKSQITALSNLMRDQAFRTHFIEHSGMGYLLAVFLNEGDEYDVVRRKVAQLVTDNFLDEELGAVLGVWPKVGTKVLSEDVCAGESRLEDGCWVEHVRAFGAAKGRKLKWAKDFEQALTGKKPGEEAVVTDREL